MKRNNAKIILLGMGAREYTVEERDRIAKDVEDVDPEICITRDEKTYELYKDIIHCYSGIDSALWSINDYDGRDIRHINYECRTFNRIKEPEDITCSKEKVIRPIHHLWGLDRSGGLLDKEGLFVTDNPYDYLTLYANAKRVYTDMVHCTLVCLMYGTPVRYYYFDKRSAVIEALHPLEQSGFLTLDRKAFEEKKRDEEEILAEYFAREAKV